MSVMKLSLLMVVVMMCACSCATQSFPQSETEYVLPRGNSVPLIRQKRTLLLKKKILGVGAVGFGLGIGIGAYKGYQHGYGNGFKNGATTVLNRPVIIEGPYYPNYYYDRPPQYYPNNNNNNNWYYG